MTLAVAGALSPNKPNLDMTLAVGEALSPNKPNLDMTLAVAEALSPNKPTLDMTLVVAEAWLLLKALEDVCNQNGQGHMKVIHIWSWCLRALWLVVWIGQFSLRRHRPT